MSLNSSVTVKLTENQDGSTSKNWYPKYEGGGAIAYKPIRKLIKKNKKKTLLCLTIIRFGIFKTSYKSEWVVNAKNISFSPFLRFSHFIV